MKRITFKRAMFAAVDVPDDCPDTPDAAQKYCEDRDLQPMGYQYNDADYESVIFIDQYDVIDGVEEEVRCIYEE